MRQLQKSQVDCLPKVLIDPHVSGSFTLFCIIKGATPEFGVSVINLDNHRFPKKQLKAEFPARKKTHSFTKTLRHIAVAVGIPLIYPLTVLVQWNKFKLQLPKDITESLDIKTLLCFPLLLLFLCFFYPHSSWKQTEAGSWGIVSSLLSRSPGSLAV